MLNSKFNDTNLPLVFGIACGPPNVNPNRLIGPYNLAHPSIYPLISNGFISFLAIFKISSLEIEKLSSLFEINSISLDAVAKGTFSCMFSLLLILVLKINSLSTKPLVLNFTFEFGVSLLISKVAAILFLFLSSIICGWNEYDFKSKSNSSANLILLSN